MADLFDCVVSAEEDFIKQGEAEGVKDGAVAGFMEGRDLGIQKGYEIGQEVGFYAGCVCMWRAFADKHPQTVPEKALKGISVLEDMVEHFPLLDPQNEGLHDALESLRGRFKVVASLLGCLQDYFPKEEPTSLAF